MQPHPPVHQLLYLWDGAVLCELLYDSNGSVKLGGHFCIVALSIVDPGIIMLIMCEVHHFRAELGLMPKQAGKGCEVLLLQISGERRGVGGRRVGSD